MFISKKYNILFFGLMAILSLLVVQQVSAQWTQPPNTPGQGNINPPLTNPLQQDLDFEEAPGTRHSIINGLNATFSGTVQSGTVRGNNVCIGGVCKNVWPSGDVTNPLSSDLDADDKFSIIRLRSCEPKVGDSCGALEAIAEINSTGDVNTFSSGLWAETLGTSGSESSYAVYGASYNTGGIGIYGYGASGWAGYFYGRFGVTGDSDFYGNINLFQNSGVGGTLTVENQICLGGVCRSDWPIPGGGSQWLNGSASSIYYNLGNVGIGVADPAEKLQVAGNLRLSGGAITEGDILNVDEIKGNNDLFLKGNNTETADVHLSGSNIRAWTSGTEKFTVLNNGNVGVGANNPSQKLQVAGNILLSGANPANITASDNNNLRFSVGGVGDFQWYSGATSRMSLYDNGTFVVPGAWDDQLVVQQTSGNVGIHKGTPSARLHIETSDLNASGNGFRMGGRGNFYIDSAGALGGRFSLLDNGDVGIGFPSPTAKLDVNGTIKANGRPVTTYVDVAAGTACTASCGSAASCIARFVGGVGSACTATTGAGTCLCK